MITLEIASSGSTAGSTARASGSGMELATLAIAERMDAHIPSA